MRRIMREYPGASIEEVMQLFRDAAVDNLAVFEAVVVAYALRRDPAKPQEEPRCSVPTLVTRQGTLEQKGLSAKSKIAFLNPCFHPRGKPTRSSSDSQRCPLGHRFLDKETRS
jgi:hypothetical protein